MAVLSPFLTLIRDSFAEPLQVIPWDQGAASRYHFTYDEIIDLENGHPVWRGSTSFQLATVDGKALEVK